MAHDTVASESVSQDAAERTNGYLDCDSGNPGRSRCLGAFEFLYAISALRATEQSQDTADFALQVAVAMANQFRSRCERSTSLYRSKTALSAPLQSGCACIGIDAL
jgi:hypothetical protein